MPDGRREMRKTDGLLVILLEALKFSGLVETASACDRELNSKTVAAAERTAKRLRSALLRSTTLLKILRGSDSDGGDVANGSGRGENQSERLGRAKGRRLSEEKKGGGSRLKADCSAKSSSASSDSSTSGVCSSSDTENIGSYKGNGRLERAKTRVGPTERKRATQSNCNASEDEGKEHGRTEKGARSVDSSSASSEDESGRRAGLGAARLPRFVPRRRSSKLNDIDASPNPGKARVRKARGTGGDYDDTGGVIGDSSARSSDSSDLEKRDTKISSELDSGASDSSNSSGIDKSSGSGSSSSENSKSTTESGSIDKARLGTDGKRAKGGRGNSEASEIESSSSESSGKESSSISDTDDLQSRMTGSSDSGSSQDLRKAMASRRTLIPAVEKKVTSTKNCEASSSESSFSSSSESSSSESSSSDRSSSEGSGKDASSSSDTDNCGSKIADSSGLQDTGKARTSGRPSMPAVQKVLAPSSNKGKRSRLETLAVADVSQSDSTSTTSSHGRDVAIPSRNGSKHASRLNIEGNQLKQSAKKKGPEKLTPDSIGGTAQCTTKGPSSKSTRGMKLEMRDKRVSSDFRDQGASGERVPNGAHGVLHEAVILGTSVPGNGVPRSKSTSNLTIAIGDESQTNLKKRRLSDTGIHHIQNTPFKRVREDSVKFQDDRLRDNTFFSKADTFGLKAHQDLSVTRGKGFRKVMTKKKRQAHHGGTLDPNNVSSFKFSDSDSD